MRHDVGLHADANRHATSPIAAMTSGRGKMPSRKQATKQAARKRPAAKKTAPKKTAKTPKKSALVQRIGVVTSIDLNLPLDASGQTLRNAFENAINNPNVTIQYEPNPPTYDINELVNAVNGFNDHNNFGLIVTFGGVGAATAASHHSTDVPWLMLVGGTLGLPDQPSGKFFGGVNLDTFGQNQKRLSHFTNDPPPPHRIPLSQICLLYNPNSACSNAEAGGWTGAPAVRAWTGSNDRNKYPNAFGSIPSSIRVVVISADPYFQETKDDLIAAANAWIAAGANRRVCYPLQEYSNTGGGHPHPNPGHTLHGPSLMDAYQRMGRKARTVLQTGNRSTLTTLTIGNANDH
jgi:hypothetical protein